MSLQHYIEEFAAIKLNPSGGHKSPHKVCLLLVIMKQVETNSITTNRFVINAALQQAFTDEFNKVAQGADANNISQPYFYLQSSSFWHHQVFPQHQAEYQQRIAPGQRNYGGANIVKNIIEYAYVDDELFEYFKSYNARERLKDALLDNLNEAQRKSLLEPIQGWSWQECEAIVADYFTMLEEELKGHTFNKADHNRHLQQQLNHSRNRSAIENKHQNISAILKEMGMPIIDGYKPLSNYQRNILPDVVGAQLAKHAEITQLIEAINTQPASVPSVNDILSCLVEAPSAKPKAEQKETPYAANPYKPRKRNYLEQEINNHRLGLSGEEFILNFEKARLIAKGKDNLADNIQHISLSDDSAGFDIHSYEENGKDRFIEVKTTNYDRYSRFFVSPNELKKSEELEKHYHLYRVYHFKQSPQFFIKQGKLNSQFQLTPSAYMATIE